MDINTGILIGSLVIAFSGWAKFFYDLFTSKPKISGKIFSVIRTQRTNQKENITDFFAYLYLVNERKNSVHILDYELEFDSGQGFEKLERVYGVHNVQNWQVFFETPAFPGEKVEIPDMGNKLIYRNNKPVEYGVPLHGFVLFAGKNESSSFNNIRKYKVTVIDAFQKRHGITCSVDKFANLYLLMDIAGMKLPPLKT